MQLSIKLINDGVTLYAPLLDNGCDFVVDSGSGLKKVQVKSSTYQDKAGYFRVNTSTGSGATKKSAGEDVDIIAIHITPLDTWYLIPSIEINTLSVKVYPDREGCRFTQYKDNWSIFEK